METKRIISTQPLTFVDRTVVQRKVVLEFSEFVIYGKRGFAVKTIAFTEVPLTEGQTDTGLLNRLQFLNNKTTLYTNEQIQGLFQMVNESIDISVDSFPDKIRDMMSQALLLAVCSENTFGLSNPSDWEFVTDEMLTPVITPTEPDED